MKIIKTLIILIACFIVCSPGSAKTYKINTVDDWEACCKKGSVLFGTNEKDDIIEFAAGKVFDLTNKDQIGKNYGLIEGNNATIITNNSYPTILWNKGVIKNLNVKANTKTWTVVKKVYMFPKHQVLMDRLFFLPFSVFSLKFVGRHVV